MGILSLFLVTVSCRHFFRLKDVSHLLSQYSSILRSSYCWVESVGVLMMEKRMVLSAKRWALDLIPSPRLLILIKKRDDPRTEPWDTPEVTDPV